MAYARSSIFRIDIETKNNYVHGRERTFINSDAVIHTAQQVLSETIIHYLQFTIATIV